MADSSKPKDQTPAADAPADQSKIPQLGALEEDDEFEEFPAAGKTRVCLGGDASELTLRTLSKTGITPRRLWQT